MIIATSSTNGKRVCSTQLRNNCLGGFKVGGNCNNQQVVSKHIKYEDDLDDDDDIGGDSEVDDGDDDNYDPLHQRLDSSRLPPSEFQMGTEQGGGAVDTRCSIIKIIIVITVIIASIVMTCRPICKPCVFVIDTNIPLLSCMALPGLFRLVRSKQTWQ